MAIFTHRGLSTAARVFAAAWIVLLSVAGAAPAWAEAGERYVPDVTAPPPLVAEGAPVMGVLPVAGDPPHMESARGSVRRHGLAQRPEPRAAASKSVEGVIPMPKRPAPQALVQEELGSPGSVLFHRAAAAELGSIATPSVASWRRMLGSPYVAWIALIVLVGVPLFGLLRAEITGWRVERGLVKRD